MSLLDNIKRPTLLLDERKCRENIRQMAEKARRSDVFFRPHFKSHQSVIIGEWFREEGVNAITVSSVEMASYFAEAGWEDITIAFPVNMRELDEIDKLAEKINLNLLVTSTDSLQLLTQKLSNRIGIFIEIDTGYGRSGLTQKDIIVIEKIIRGCRQSSNLHFMGFLSHFGESYQARNKEEIEQIYHHGVNDLQQIRDSLDKGPRGILSVGDTPACNFLESFTGVDEIRPGNFIFNDVMQMEIGSCTSDQITICLAAPVVDIYPDRKEAIVYAGAIHLSKEKINYNGQEVFGLVVNLEDEGWSEPVPGCIVLGLSQEHGILRLDPAMFSSLQPGSLIGILPVHACLTADAMKHYLTIQGKPVSMFTGF